MQKRKALKIKKKLKGFNRQFQIYYISVQDPTYIQ